MPKKSIYKWVLRLLLSVLLLFGIWWVEVGRNIAKDSDPEYWQPPPVILVDDVYYIIPGQPTEIDESAEYTFIGTVQSVPSQGEFVTRNFEADSSVASVGDKVYRYGENLLVEHDGELRLMVRRSD